eukprot:TRINITY_DN8115_c0_g1_i3.p1 TRINITY_DN8115_c0_g1~~TRINITY_DN8115_c0_g1_i3.p1  ORF type:complete len:249 (+),score=43.10 TRINITY_DN8115_c0_g1_i3:158-904(+)
MASFLCDAMRLFPDALSLRLLHFHHDYIYNPLNRRLSWLANQKYFPTWLSPNMITFAAGACIVPCIQFLNDGTPDKLAFAALLTVAHDLLDRLDGAVARSDHHKVNRSASDGEFGAFLDAQVDKLFHIGMLTALLYSPLHRHLPSLWRYGAYVKIGIQATLAVVRISDYVAARQGHKRNVKAQGEGKLATCAANTAAATALATLSLKGYGYEQASTVFGYTTAGLLTVAVDMALRSLANKLRARLVKA